MSTTSPALQSNITLPRDHIAALCEKYQVEELSVFGSVLRVDFGPESDVDFLVVFKDNDAGPWMSKVFDMEKDLSTLLGRKIDVVMKGGVEQSGNWLTQGAILGTSQVIYRVPDGPAARPETADRPRSEADHSPSGIPPLVLRGSGSTPSELPSSHAVTISPGSRSSGRCSGMISAPRATLTSWFSSSRGTLRPGNSSGCRMS